MAPQPEAEELQRALVSRRAAFLNDLPPLTSANRGKLAPPSTPPGTSSFRKDFPPPRTSAPPLSRHTRKPPAPRAALSKASSSCDAIPISGTKPRTPNTWQSPPQHTPATGLRFAAARIDEEACAETAEDRASSGAPVETVSASPPEISALDLSRLSNSPSEFPPLLEDSSPSPPKGIIRRHSAPRLGSHRRACSLSSIKLQPGLHPINFFLSGGPGEGLTPGRSPRSFVDRVSRDSSKASPVHKPKNSILRELERMDKLSGDEEEMERGGQPRQRSAQPRAHSNPILRDLHRLEARDWEIQGSWDGSSVPAQNQFSEASTKGSSCREATAAPGERSRRTGVNAQASEESQFSIHVAPGQVDSDRTLGAPVAPNRALLRGHRRAASSHHFPLQWGEAEESSERLKLAKAKGTDGACNESFVLREGEDRESAAMGCYALPLPRVQRNMTPPRNGVITTISKRGLKVSV